MWAASAGCMRKSPESVQPVEQFFHLSLLGTLASGYFALAASGRLDIPAIVLTGLGLLFHLAAVTGRIRFPFGRASAAAATVAYIGFYPLDFLYVSRGFIPATVHLICFLAVVCVLTARTNRDYFFVKVLAFLQLVAATLLSTSLNFFVFLIAFIVFGVATFACSEIRRSAQRTTRVIFPSAGFARRLTALTAVVAAAILLMTVGLFLMLPRTARAALRTFVPAGYHLPGFSDEVTLGQIGELKATATPVMHIRIEAPNEKLAIKWRGTALSQFDGRRWYNPPGISERVETSGGEMMLANDSQRLRFPPGISYQVRLGSVDTDTLFFAGVPEVLMLEGFPAVYRSRGDRWRTGGPTAGREYKAISHPAESGSGWFGEDALSEMEWNEHLLLPGNTDRRIIELAKKTGVGGSALDRARAIEQHLRTRYRYTTMLPDKSVSDPMAQFLFERREGHCEYFASAMAVLLRSIHIPSRVVTGFQSGSYNPLTGWTVVRSSDAHSWVEAWLPDRGWMTFDPTPPDTRSRSAAAALWINLLLYADTAETFWREWVVGYNLEHQLDLFTRVERQSRSLHNALSVEDLSEVLDTAAKVARTWAGPVLTTLLFAGLAVWFGPRVWRRFVARKHAARIARGHTEPSDAAMLYDRMLRILRARGFEKPAWLTPGEFAQVLPDAAASALVREITAAYHELRYGGSREAGPRMMQLLEKLQARR